MNRNFAKVQIGAATVEVPVEVISESLRAALHAHPDDIAVERFAAAMKDKLAASRVKGRGGWQDKSQCSSIELSDSLLSHAAKGDPIDVANFAMMLHQRGESISLLNHAQSLANGSIPPIGSYWPGEGGIYAGIIRGDKGDPDLHLIVPTADEAEFETVEWGEYGQKIEGADSNLYGGTNTLAMKKAGCDIAQRICALEIEGHTDFYLPARHELRLCYLNVPELFQKTWYWTSTQCSADDAFCQGFDDGTQDTNGKSYKFRARAVRSIQVSNSVIR